MAYSKWCIYDGRYSQRLQRLGTFWRPPSDFTMAFRHYRWSKNPSGSSQQVIFRKGGSSGIDLVRMWIEYDNELHMAIRSSSGSTVEIYWTGVLLNALQRWMVTCTLANPNATKMEAFLDGASQGNGTIAVGGTVTSLQSGSGNLYVGYTYTGAISEMAAFSAVLSDATILSYASNDIQSSDTDLYTLWTLDDTLDEAKGLYPLSYPGGEANPDFLDIVVAGAGDTNAPVVANMTPTAGGDLATSYNAARLVPIEFDVTDVDPGISALVVSMKYVNAEDTQVVYDGTKFLWPFNTSISAITSIANGYHVKLWPVGGWPSAIEQMFVYATDGNIESLPPA